MANTIGMKTVDHEKSADSYFRLYQSQVSGIAIDPKFCAHDGSSDYERYFNDVLARLADAHILKELTQEISWCECGRVEIPTEAARALIQQQRSKSLIEGDSLESARCKVCRSGLHTDMEQTLVTTLPRITIRSIPGIYAKELGTIADRIAARTVTVSRRHRSHGVCYDTDFRWFPYITSLSQTDKDVVIVSSPTTLNQAMKVIAITSMLDPTIQCTLLVHPLIRIRDQRTALSGMSIERFYQLISSPLARRFLLAASMQWTSHETSLGSEEIHLISQTAEIVSSYGINNDQFDSISPENFVHFFNRGATNRLLKAIRTNSLQPEDGRLLQLINPH
ncbi:MAG TPA: hypothetical protein VMR99_01620 [Candidatus Paceibacterota bacterium]|nr:hypothetical protein [Candidatus Paceibacterota bacterium]